MPLGESMISSLKSNESIKLDKSKRFRKTMGGYSKSKRTEYDFPKATPELIKRIKEKMLKQHKRQHRVSIILLGSILIVALICLVKLKLI